MVVAVGVGNMGKAELQISLKFRHKTKVNGVKMVLIINTGTILN